MGKYDELTRGQEEAIVNKLGGMEGVRRFLRGELEIKEVEVKKSTLNSYRVTINYGLSLEQMIAAGRYDWKNSDITAKHFPVKGEGTADVDIHLIHLNRSVESDEAIKEMDQMGFRPAKIEELLALGAQRPELQREFPIVALGSVWRRVFGRRCVPSLWFGGGGRDLFLYWLESRWGEDYRFAAVRK